MTNHIYKIFEELFKNINGKNSYIWNYRIYCNMAFWVLIKFNKKIDLFGYSLKPNTKPSIFKSLKQEERINYQQYGNVLNEKKF